MLKRSHTDEYLKYISYNAGYTATSMGSNFIKHHEACRC